MVRVAPRYGSFNSGELSELLEGRPDFVRFQNGLRRCRGFLPLPEGPVTRTPGTEVLGRVHEDAPARLTAFQFSDGDVMMLEWTDGKLRFWRNRKLVDHEGAPFMIASPYDDASISAMQWSQSADRVYLVDGLQHPKRLNRHALKVWTFEDTPFANGPFLPRNLFQTAEITPDGVLGSIGLTASTDLFDAAHVGVPFKLWQIDYADYPEWTGNTTVVLDDFMYSVGNLYKVITLGDGNTGVNPPTHSEGDWLANKGGVTWRFISSGFGIVRITAVTDARNATAQVERRLPTGLKDTPTYRWAEGAWSDLQGWPGALGFFGQRHVYGGTPEQPRALWFSVLGGTVDMEAGTNDDDGFSYTLDPAQKGLGKIVSILRAGEALHIGTTEDEYVASRTDQDRAFGVQTADFNNDTSNGVAAGQALAINGVPVMLHKNLRELFALIIDPSVARFTDDTLTDICRHVLGPGAAKIVYQSHPVPIIWCMRSDGQLASLTYQPRQQVLGWSIHPMCGGAVEDMEVIATREGDSQELWLVVKRQFGPNIYRFVEVMKKPFIALDGTDPVLADAWMVQCALRWQGPATDTIPGLSHLEGQTVTAWTNKGGFDGLVVTSGQVVLPRADITSAIVGLCANEDQWIETLDTATGAQDGGEEGRRKVQRATGIRLHRTVGGTVQVVGRENGAWREAPVEPILSPSATGDPQVLSGVFEFRGGAGWDFEKFLRVRPSPGAPMTVQSLTPTVMVSDS